MSAERRHLLSHERQNAEDSSVVLGVPISTGSSVDELIDNIGFGWYQIRLAILIGVALLADGMETSLISLIQGCVIVTFDVSTVYESIFSSAVFLGQISGMVVIAPLADLYGRKVIIMLGYFLIMVFGLVSYVSPDIWVLIGTGIGASQAISYDLFIETLPTTYRSRTIFMSGFVIVGEVLVVGLGWWLIPSYGWEWLVFAAALPVTSIIVPSFFFVDESPRWLILQGRYDEAESIIKNMAAVNNSNIAVKLKTSKLDVSDSTFNELISPQYINTTIVIWLTWFFGYFLMTSIFLLIAYIFNTTSDDDTCSYNYGYIFLSVNLEFVGLYIVALLVNHVDRSTIQFYAYNIVAVIIMIFGFLYSNDMITASEVLIMFTKICLPTACIITWLQTSESYPTELRGRGHSVACVMGKFGAFCAVFWVDDLTVYHFLAGCLVLSLFGAIAAVNAKWIPETRYNKLDEIRN